MKNQRSLSALIALGLMAQPLAVSAADNTSEAAPDKVYKVRKGDTLSEIAMRYLWPLLWEYNKDTIKNPHLIVPGQKILIPTTFMPAVADPFASAAETPYIADLWEVKASIPKDADFHGNGGAIGALTAGQAFRQTGEFIVKDGPLRLRIHNDTELRIYGGSRVRLHGYRQEGDKLVRKIEVREGRVQLRSASSDNESWVVEAAGSTLTVANGRVDVTLENKNVALFSTYDGLSELDSSRGRVEIAGNQGVRVIRDQEVQTASLPDAPQGKAPIGVVKGKFDMSWKPVDGVNNYRLRIAHDMEFDDVVFEGEVYRDTKFPMNLAEVGTYYWTVEAVDDKGFSSRPTPPARIDIGR